MAQTMVCLGLPASKTTHVWENDDLIIAGDKDPPIPRGFSSLQNGWPHQTTVVQPFGHKPAMVTMAHKIDFLGRATHLASSPSTPATAPGGS